MYEYRLLRSFASPAKAKEAGAAALTVRESRKAASKSVVVMVLRDRVGSSPWLFFFSLLFLFISVRNFIRATYRLYKLLYGFLC
jgi:hypothetical protein